MKSDDSRFEDICTSIKEAERFIERARKAYSSLSKGETDFYRSAPFAAAKRASLDLSNALIEMRR